MCSENYRSEVIAAEVHVTQDKALDSPFNATQLVPRLPLPVVLVGDLIFTTPPRSSGRCG